MSVSDRIMDISLNLARVGNWTADSYEQKKTLIERFVSQTNRYVEEVPQSQLSSGMVPLFIRFKSEFEQLQEEKITEENKDEWAEKVLTWANILQHRAKLA